MYDIFEIAIHIINRCWDIGRPISMLKLQKILYFVQAECLVSKDEPLFKEDFEAWTTGPIIPKIGKEFRVFGACSIPRINVYVKNRESGEITSTRGIRSNSSCDVHAYQDNVISAKDKQWIDEIVDFVSQISLTDLIHLTRNQSPWINARDIYERAQRYCPDVVPCQISKEAIRSFFMPEEEENLNVKRF